MTDDHTEYRAKCLDAKGRKCTLCRSTENVVVHHIDGEPENNALDNLMPVCRGCHNRIHAGSVEELSEQLPDEARSDKPAGRTAMRPNIRVSHEFNGRVRDFAGKRDLSASDAYELLIRTGLQQLRTENDNSTSAST